MIHHKAVLGSFNQFRVRESSPMALSMVLKPKSLLYKYRQVRVVTIPGTSIGITKAVFTILAIFLRRIKNSSSAASKGQNTLLNTDMTVIMA